GLVTEPLTARMQGVGWPEAFFLCRRTCSSFCKSTRPVMEPEKFGPAKRIRFESGDAESIIFAALRNTSRSTPSVGISGIRNTSRYFGRFPFGESLSRKIKIPGSGDSASASGEAADSLFSAAALGAGHGKK